MPIYEYYCNSCENKFNMFHSMSESCQNCGFCESEDITRVIPDIANTVDKSKFKTKAGDLVKSHIEEARKEVREQKQDMKRGMK